MGAIVSSRAARVDDCRPASPSTLPSDASASRRQPRVSADRRFFGRGSGSILRASPPARRISIGGYLFGQTESGWAHPADAGVPFEPAPLTAHFSAALPSDVAAGAWRAEPKPPRSG